MNFSNFPPPNPMPPPETPFIGLAPFLRMSVAGTDLLPLGQAMLAQAERDAYDANLWLNLATAMLCLGQRDLGLSLQSLALELRRVYHLAAAEQPAKFRLLMLMVPGDLAANTPLDCLLENSDIDLEYYYLDLNLNLGLAPDALLAQPIPIPIPKHDALIVAISEADENHELLASLQEVLADWPKPVINAPQYIPLTGRAAASNLLQDVPGLLIPPTLRASRSLLQAIATGGARLPELFEDCDFPIILRPVGSHAGRDLDKITCAEEITGYLSRVDELDFFLARFIDYSGKDGLFRKMRVALVDGVPFACHMGVSSSWMIHYVNVGMYEEAWKRNEEYLFMEHFSDFAERHRLALEAIYRRTKLDYLCIDCAETQDGQLLIFEIDPAMVVHAMDTELLFPYKQVHMQKVKNAFRDFLFRLTASRFPPPSKMSA